MGGGNPLKRIEKQVKRSGRQVEKQVSRSGRQIEKEFGRIEDNFKSWFGLGGGSPAPAPAPEPEPEPDPIIYDDELLQKTVNEKEEEDLSLLTTKATTGHFADEGRTRVAQTKSGVGTGSTSGLGY